MVFDQDTPVERYYEQAEDVIQLLFHFLLAGNFKITNNFYFFIFSERWEKVNLTFQENGTVTFQQQKIFKFDPEQSVGDVEDMVVVPNIPMLVSSIYYLYSYSRQGEGYPHGEAMVQSVFQIQV